MKFPTVDQVLSLGRAQGALQAIADHQVAESARATITDMQRESPDDKAIGVMEHLAEALELRAQILAYTAVRGDLPEDKRVEGLTTTTADINMILETMSSMWGMPSLIRGENEVA